MAPPVEPFLGRDARHEDLMTRQGGDHDVGPAHGKPVILLYGWPFGPVGSYVDAAPALARRGYRCYIPCLRGHEETHFLRYGRGGRAGGVVEAPWPERCPQERPDAFMSAVLESTPWGDDSHLPFVTCLTGDEREGMLRLVLGDTQDAVHDRRSGARS
jgi:hypothetical protein